MGRYSSKNKVAKSSGLGKGMANSRSTSNPVNLTPEQQEKVEKLKEELKYYQNERRQISGKRNKISRILDNFEKIVVGDILLDILPDENSEEITNSAILSKNEILLEINNNNVPGVDVVTKTLAVKYIDALFKIESIKELTERSSELDPGEIYSAILLNMIETRSVPGVAPFIASRVKQLLYMVVEKLEDDLL